MLRVYNSLTKEKEIFEPIVPGKVRMYVCGMTVYDYCHLGHARMLVVFDVIARWLRASGYELTYVRNITDIDDKIIRRAKENGESIETLTARFIRYMDEDLAALGVIKPDHEPRATHYVEDMQRMIAKLVEKGHAYVGPNGDVYYRVASFPAYGRLSGKDLHDLRAGARVEVDEAKEDPLDFVLWKHAKPDEPAWPPIGGVPWGPGRPGWHIECSVMSTRLLGEYFDIHGGGMDLKFPHHENEIAQSCGATGQPFVKYWLHNGFVQVDEEKMSKSLGNFFTVREVLARYRPEVVRFFILNSHYRSPLNYSDQQLEQAKHSLERLYLALRDAPAGAEAADADPAVARFRAAMDDDFNTPEALAVLFELAHDANRAQNVAERARYAALIRRLGGVLGLLQQDPEAFLKGGSGVAELTDSEIEALVAQRDAARRARNWKEADRIRDLLKEKRVVLEDSAGQTRWRRE